MMFTSQNASTFPGAESADFEKQHREFSKDTVSTTDEGSVAADLRDTDTDFDEDVEAQDTQPAEPSEQSQNELDERLKQRLCGRGAQLVVALANVLENLCAGGVEGSVTPFHSSSIPPISILDYLRRIHHNSQCSDACLVLALIFIDRLGKMRPQFKLSRINAHRLIATSMVMAAKVHDDIFYSNAYYARVVGMKPRELGLLEGHLLRLVGWRVHVSAEEFEEYLNVVLLTIA